MGIRRAKLSVFVALITVLLSAIAAFAKPADKEKLAYSYYLRGAVIERLGDPISAIGQYRHTVSFDLESSRPHLRLGIQYLALKKMDLASKELKSAVELNPDDLEARISLALVYLSLKNSDEAVKQYEFILKKQSELEPDNIEIIRQLAQIYYQQKKFDEAILEYRRLTALMPDTAEAYLFLGGLLGEAGDIDAGIVNIKKALEVKPGYPQACNSLAYLYALKGENLDEALGLIQKALADDGDNPVYIDTLGWVYFKKGELSEALKHLERAVKILDDAVIYDHLADVYSANGLFEQAKKAWQKSLELDPSQIKIKEKIKNVKNK